MKNSTRIIVACLIVISALTWTACSSDGYEGTSTVYVGVSGYPGYGGYGPGWGAGWGGYGGYPGRGFYGPRW